MFFFARTHDVNSLCLLYFNVDDKAAAMNPGLINGLATSALEDNVSTSSDFAEFFFWILKRASTDLPVQDDMTMLLDVQSTTKLSALTYIPRNQLLGRLVFLLCRQDWHLS